MRIRHGTDQQLSGSSGLSGTDSVAAEMPTRSKLTRRTVVAAMAAGSALATPWIRPAFAADALSVRLDFTPHAMHCSFHLAAEKGWFTKAGLDVRVEDGSGSTTTVQIVGGGTFDIGHAALAPMAIGLGNGLPVISIAGFERKGDMGILVDSKLNVTKLEQLEGRKIDYTAGSLEGPFVEPFFTMNHIPMDKLQLLNVDITAKLSTYLTGQVDGIITAVPTFFVILKSKRPVDSILFADHGMNLPSFGLITRPDVLKSKGDAVKRLTSVLCSAWTYIFDGHEDEAAEALMVRRPNAGLVKQEVIDTLALYHPFFYSDNTKNTPIGIQSADDWAATIKVLETAKVVPDGSKPADYFTNDYIDYAYGNKIVGIAG
jgi:NitT/TauT family transport system substrate-binding protein